MPDNGTVVNLNQPAVEIGNDEFLREVFQSDWERAHVCGFREDPTTLDTSGLRHLWAGGEARNELPFHPDANVFFTISVFHPDPISGLSRRRKVQFDRTYCIVIDDVGLRGLDGTSAKVPADKVMLKPSWALETSPGNWQLGYIIEGGDDRGGKIVALLDAMVAKGLVSDGSDPGMKGVTRYVRLPVGKNTKSKYGTAGHRHVLGSWRPERKYRLEDIADAYGCRGELDAASDDLNAPTAGNFDPDNDYIAEVLIDAGLVSSFDQVKKLWHVTCPFIDEHTGRADTGTAYLGGGRWTCHHGHCEQRDHSDFTEKLRADFPDEWKKVTRDGLMIEDAASIAPSQKRQEMEDLFGSEAVERVEKAKAAAKNILLRGNRKWSDLETATVVPPEFVVPGYLPRGLVTTLYGEDGIGKNMLTQRACMMGVAEGEFWGQRVSADFKAAFIGVEDPDAAILDRAQRIGRSRGFTAREWARLDARFFMPELIDVDAKLMGWDREGNHLYGRMIKWIAQFVDAWKPDLLVLDPISDLFEDEESNRQRVVGFMRMLIRLARKKDIAILLLGHPARSEGSEYSGSGAWSSKSRSRLFMVRDEDDEDVVWLQHRKVSYGAREDDRECRWNQQYGVLEDRSGVVVAPGSPSALAQIGDAIRDYALADTVLSASHKHPNSASKTMKADGKVRGLSQKQIQEAITQAIKDGFLVGNHLFDGTNGSPDIRYHNRTPKKGLWFAT